MCSRLDASWEVEINKASWRFWSVFLGQALNKKTRSLRWNECLDCILLQCDQKFYFPHSTKVLHAKSARDPKTYEINKARWRFWIIFLSRPAGRPEANSPIYYRFKNISLRVPFWRLTAQYTIDLGPFSLWSSLRVRFWRAYRTSRGRFLVIFVTDWSFTFRRKLH